MLLANRYRAEEIFSVSISRNKEKFFNFNFFNRILNLACFEKYLTSILLHFFFISLSVFVHIQDSIFKKSKRILEYRFFINAKDESYETMKNATKLEIVVHIDGRTIVSKYTKRK